MQDNEAAYEYLKLYCADARILGYPVLLSGPWGAGKTYFVKEFLKEQEIKHLYVNLYGMTSIGQIEKEFSRQLHPVWSSKPMRLLGSVTKSLLKATVNVDTNGDGTSDGSVSPTMPDLEHIKLANPSGRILVFDDLERCPMELDETLGFINSLVEHSDFKVIVIANEVEIIKRKNERYPELKEKLVGQTFEVRSSATDALNAFVDTIANENAHTFLEKNKSKIIEIYQMSDGNNLRALKHALWDFERFATAWGPQVWKHKEAPSWLLSVMLALSMDFRLGRLSPDEMDDLFANGMLRLVKKMSHKNTKDDTQLSRIELFEERYKNVSFDQSRFDGHLLADGLRRGGFDPETIKKGFAASSFFANRANQPAWRIVWSALDVNDRDFNAALGKMEGQFKAREFLQPGEILHVTGLRLMLSEAGVIPLSKTDVVKESKAYIDDLEKTDRLAVSDNSEFTSYSGGWDGLGIYEKHTAEFQDVLNYLQVANNGLFNKGLPSKAQALLKNLRNDPTKFVGKIMSYGSANIYCRTPLLQHIKVQDFIDTLLGLEPSNQRLVMSALNNRYEHERLASDLVEERAWIEDVRSELLKGSQHLSALTRWRLAKFVEWSLDPVLRTPQHATSTT